MDRNEILRRQQMRKEQRGIPGWLWGLVIGAIVALIATGNVVRLSSNVEGAFDPTKANTAEGSSAVAPQAPSTLPGPRVQMSPPQPQGGSDLDRFREEVEALRRERQSAAERQRQAPTPSVHQEQEAEEPEPSLLDQMAEAEKECRPIFAEFQKRYSRAKKEHEDRVNVLKQYQAQCDYTQIGEPTEAQKRRGARQEGLPANLVMGGTIEYSKLNCDTIDLDLRRAEQDRFEALRDIQRECYDDAIARGVSTAKARLR